MKRVTIALLEHTSSGDVADFSINGISMPEAGYNSLIAGYYDVPVVFAAGDRALCEQVEGLLDDVETVAVKEGIGAAALTLHPEVSHERIRLGVQRALRDLDRFEPFKLDTPYTLVLRLKTEESVYRGSFFPGAERTGDWELTYSSDDFLEVMYAFGAMRR
jgi:D-amino peptidase